ncbi:MAG: DUF819 family protein, partial [Myxococcales bacterium]|nr:DUF819 family protein [Myxococcales bacterium]
ALLVILLGVAVGNLGVVPLGGRASAALPLYQGVFTHVARLAIFWLLLTVDLRSVLRAGLPAIGLFLIGALGTVVGVLVGVWAVGGRELFGDVSAPLAGMFAATYTGGSINFNAVALHYGVHERAVIYTGTVAIDNIVTTVWMTIGIALPRLLARGRGIAATARAARAAVDERERVRPRDLAFWGATGLVAVWAAGRLAILCERALGLEVPSIVLLTALALALAQVRSIRAQPGAGVLGGFAVYLFLAVIGVHCDLAAVGELGETGLAIAGVACVTVLVHGAFTYGGARLLGLDPAVASVVSQANIGGATSAMALARSLEREELVLPAILLGALGLALGTFIGFLVAGALG